MFNAFLMSEPGHGSRHASRLEDLFGQDWCFPAHLWWRVPHFGVHQARCQQQGGCDPPHVQITKQYALLFNRNKHKAMLEFKSNPMKSRCRFFQQERLQAVQKSGSAPRASRTWSSHRRHVGMQSRIPRQLHQEAYHHLHGCRWLV